MAESEYRIEPTSLSELPSALSDRVADIVAAATKLEGALAPETAASLADVVRSMNCYYSNLIEGHNTRLKDIESALDAELSENNERRALQLEARAHIRVQRSIDAEFAASRLPEPASSDFIKMLHRAFYADATPAMLRIGDSARSFQMEPGAYRQRPDQDNAVGLHQPPSSSHVAVFMQRFEQCYRFADKGRSERIVAMAIAHHRFNYIHPFDDGNGRVSRLMSHAMGLSAGIGARGLWSISRGLARGREERSEYHMMMNAADAPRESDLDGRGNLSLRATRSFVTWFLHVAHDQLVFMTELFDLEHLADRYERFVTQHTTLRPEAIGVLKDISKRGSLPRGEVARVSGLEERTARSLTQKLVAEKLVGSTTEKGPLTLRFPRDAVPVLFPNLYEAQALT